MNKSRVFKNRPFFFLNTWANQFVSIRFPSLVIIPALMLFTFLSFLILLYSAKWKILFFLPFAMSEFYLGAKHPKWFVTSILFLLPLIGFLNNMFSIAGISLLLPLFLSGLLGQMMETNKIRSSAVYLTLTRSTWFVLASLFLSLVLTIVSYGPSFFSPSSIIATTPWSQISLKNALGWILLAFLKGLAGILFLGLFLKMKFKGNEIKKILHILYIGFGVAFVVSILQFMDILSPHYVPGGTYVFPQYHATFTDPNALGISTALLLSLWLSSACEKKIFVVLWLVGPIILFIIALSGSRSSFLILSIIFLVFILFGIFDKTFLPPFLVFVLCICLGTTIYIQQKFDLQSRIGGYLKGVTGAIKVSIKSTIELSTTSKSRTKKLNLGQRTSLEKDESQKTSILKRNINSQLKGKGDDAKSKKDSLAETFHSVFGDRIMLWQAGWVTFKNNLLIGTGIGTYLFKMPKYVKENRFINNDNSGNMYLHIGAEQGILGLLPFLFFLSSSFAGFFLIQSEQDNVLYRGALASLLGLIIGFLFGSHILHFEVSLMFWFIIGLLHRSFPRNDALVNT